MKRTPAGRAAVAAAVLVLTGLLTGCAPGAGPATGGAPAARSVQEPPTPRTTGEPSSGLPFGTGCGGVPTAGEGSFAGMRDDPVATAVGHNPAVRAFADAIRAAHLTGPLDSQRDVTVLAPSDAAFAALPPDSLGPLMGDTSRLTAVLTHHVIPGRLPPERLAGTHTTLNDDRVTIEVSPDAFSIAAEGTLSGAAPARVVCGNVQTANATVYVIDQVLTPPAP